MYSNILIEFRLRVYQHTVVHLLLTHRTPKITVHGHLFGLTKLISSAQQSTHDTKSTQPFENTKTRVELLVFTWGIVYATELIFKSNPFDPDKLNRLDPYLLVIKFLHRRHHRHHNHRHHHRRRQFIPQ